MSLLQVQSVKKHPYFNANYRRPMKLVRNIMDCPLNFDDLIFFFLRGSSTWVSLPIFNFFSVNPQIIQQNHEVNLADSLNTNFHAVSDSLSNIRRRNCNKCKFLNKKVLLSISGVREKSYFIHTTNI